MGDVTRLVLTPVIAIYGEHPSENPDTVYDLYESILGGYENHLLTAATKGVLGTFYPSKKAPWPAPALFRTKAEEYAAKKSMASSPGDYRVERPSHAAKPTQQDIARDNDRKNWRDGIDAAYGSMDRYLLKHGPTMKYDWDKKP